MIASSLGGGDHRNSRATARAHGAAGAAATKEEAASDRGRPSDSAREGLRHAPMRCSHDLGANGYL